MVINFENETCRDLHSVSHRCTHGDVMMRERWGSVEDGDEFIPGVVDKLEGVKVVQVSAGDSHTAALTDIGSIYCWGIFRVSVCGLLLRNNVLHNFLSFPPSLPSPSLSPSKQDSNGAFGLVESSPSLAPQLLYSDPTNRAVKVASGTYI